jgi:N-acetylglucosamine-6-phosphate deacetylase
MSSQPILWVRAGQLPTEFVTGAGQHEQIPTFAATDLFVQAGRIVSRREIDSQAAVRQLDAQGCTILPGFVDVHIHGSAGYDVMDASASALAAIADFLVTHGVTAFVPTTMTAPHNNTLRAVTAVADYLPQQGRGARALGVHLEGPYISPKFPGAQPASFIRPPNLAELAELLAAGPVRMITLAPEVAGAEALIRQARAHDGVVVLGHTNATYAECLQAMRWGVSQATHTYNAMSGLHHRNPGTLGAVLSIDDIDAQLIADNIHVHPAGMKILARCKGHDHTLLISDAIRATGLPEGDYELGGQPVQVKAGECRLADGTLAGSILTMDQALRNFMAATGWSLAQAWPTTSRTAARTLGLAHEIGTLVPGARGDLVLLDEQLQVVATVVGGEVAYLRDADRLIEG